MGEQFRRVPVRPIASGRNTAQNSVLLADGESPELVNVDLDRDSIAMSGGASRFNNQTAPRPGLLVGTRANGAALQVLPGKSVPVRGALFIPYSESQDVVCADYTVDETAAPAPTNRSFARQRGKDFELQQSFRIPASEKLFTAPTRGALNAPLGDLSVNDFTTKFGADEALDEFFAIRQKGGDRMAPMSWALGVVNTGALFDIDVGGGLNIFGLSTATHAKRISNYALCFMWLDIPAYGVDRPRCAKYRLNAGSVWFDEVVGDRGSYPTFAYRAMIVPFFVEPGVDYHVALRLTRDTGSSGTTWNPGTGELSGVAWNGNGVIEWKVAESYGAVQTFSSANGAGTQVLRYKGPTDSLEYLCKYGVRYHGRDAEHIGLGFRFSPWQSGGFVPFGIDSCPVEYGGFQINDHSVHGPAISTTLYGEIQAIEQEPTGAGYDIWGLRIEYDPAVDAGGTTFGVNRAGLVESLGLGGHIWGNETTAWANIDPVFGKQPWGPKDAPWAGLGGRTAVGFNPEALRSYRLVFLRDSGGFETANACGGLMSIATYVPAVFGAYTFGQHMTMEGGDQFAATPTNPTLAPLFLRWLVGVRAFRWNQRPVVVSDVRSYSKPRTWSVVCDFSLTHELDLTRAGEPGLESLRGHWALTDGGGYEAAESILGNSGFLTPLAGQRLKDGGIFLSGEGEALYLNLAENPDFRAQLRAAQTDGLGACAIQLTMRMPEASYALAQRVNDPLGTGGASSQYRGKFAPVLAALDVEVPDRASDLLAAEGVAIGANQIDHVQGAYAPLQPLLEFGHNVFVENGIGVEPFAYPMGFSLRAPVNTAADFRVTTADVPGTGVNGLHAWHRPAGTNVSRWDKLAGWAGKDIVVQFGFQPTGTADEFIAYIAAWPKEFLNPASNDPAGAEFAYFTNAITMTRRQVERAVVVIGGSWNPRLSTTRRAGPPAYWATIGRAAHECSARMIVKDVRVFGAAAPGALPSASGSAVAAGTGKIIGDNALPLRALTASELLYPVARDDSAVNFTAGSRTVSSSGTAFLSEALPESSKLAIVRSFLTVLGDSLSVPRENTDSLYWPRTYFVSAVPTSSSLTLNRPVLGASRRASGAKCFRLLGYTAFEDEVTVPLTVGKGRGYDTTSVTTRHAQVTDKAFANLSPIGVDWRWRVYSSIPSGSSLGLLPTWTRGVKCSTWNKIRGLHAVADVLYVGAQASLFEADDRWRPYGPTDALAKSFAVRALEGRPLQGDRVVFQDSSLLDISDAWAVSGGVGYLAVLDAWLRPASLRGIQTVLWCGRLDTNPALAAGAHGIQFWSRINDGYPELVVGSSAAGPSLGLFVARGSRRLRAGEWKHVRWGVLGVPGGAPSLDEPVLWVGGKRVAVTVNATDAAAAAGTWLAQAGVQYEASYQVALGAARGVLLEPVVTRKFTASTDASRAPILPSESHGWLFAFDGELAGVVCAREPNGSAGFNTALDFDPSSIAYTTRRFAALETTQSAYGVGHRMLDAALPQFGTIYSHPLLSITHAMGGADESWSFSNYESDVFCANGGRVGVIDSKTNEFRFAGIQGPRSLPKVEIVRRPLWKTNKFVLAGDPDNDPIFNVNQDNLAPTPTPKTPAVTALVYHYNNPGTKVLIQEGEATMTWVRDSFIAFKCYLRMNSVTGRIQLFGRRDSLQSGYFLEIRDGHLVAGWWDTVLKKECSIRTSIPVIEPGYVYYVYYRKWFPRGGLASTPAPYNAQMTKADSNWANSLHCIGTAGSFNAQACYDSLIFRRFARGAQSGFFDFTGWDAKTYDKDTDLAAGYGGANNYDHTANGSSARMCVSATSADAEFGYDPYATGQSPTGMVMLSTALNGATTGDAAGRVQIAVGGSQRFLADHVGMLLQVSGGLLDKQVYRIVEFISATSVKCVTQTGAAAPFNLLVAATDTIAVYMGVSLVKSDDFDKSTAPDAAVYPIEVAGSSLQSNPLNGMAPFDGELWSCAWDMVAGDSADDGGNMVMLPNVFELADAVVCPLVLAAGTTMSCAVEVGTDVCGLQGTGNTRAGVMPWAGQPAGELAVDLTYAHTAIDTCQTIDRTVTGGYTLTATAPSSTQPNSTGAAALDAASRTAKIPVWTELNPVTPGPRVARLFFFDPERNVLSGPGAQFKINVPEEDVNNPSASVELILSLLPACPDGPGFSTRIYLSAPNSTIPLLRTQIDDDQPDSVSIAIDEVNESFLESVDVTLTGAPPEARFVAASQGRMCFANLPGQADGVMFSLPYFPEIVPIGNIFPANTGRSAITALLDFKGALVVFKRDAIIPIQFDTTSGLPLFGPSGGSDGCVSASSLAKLEDRAYYVSDRGPQVLLEGWQPFFIGRQMRDYFKSGIDTSEIERVHGTFNRRRSQYVFTAKSRTRSRMDERWSIEFSHPTAGEDVERAEMPAGHRASFYQGPNCTAVGMVEPRGGGAALMVGGTDHGFVVWLDRDDHRTTTGALILAGATPMFGSRTLTKGAASVTGTFDRTLEGALGQVLRVYQGGEQEAYVLFSANDGTDRLYLEGPLQEAMTWLTGLGVAQGTVLSLGALLWVYSTKDFDCGTVDLNKQFYYLDLTRRLTVGTAKLDMLRNQEATPTAPSKDVDLAQTYTAIGVHDALQRARVARFRLRTQTPAIDVDVEIMDLVIRLAEADPR
jgi:hypothetical protein